ncbi:pentatricopeptide repeat-containing protein, chloroplastic [Iris pallida]|uniref:Pentatricopeptide repeat-containing protein, chloroplastic n=1 Tax=Iris pallida TaxID=29817 RepID=A0AAX6G270_IRIPA|nr:pentatricopeptide repeat-containing protein, chloroplastic [Iris pallida]
MFSSAFLLCPSTYTILILRLLLPLFIIIPHHHHLQVTSAPAVLPPKHNNVTDRSSLLYFKSKVSLDPHGIFATWNDTLPFCRWSAVVCGRRHPDRVVSLNLTSLDLVGTIPPHLANLTFLRRIDLSSNHFHGPIPQDLSGMSRLQYLDLSSNSLSGVIPSKINHCLGLQIIDMSYNMLGGNIPTELGSLPSLYFLDLRNNSIIGQIPLSLANVSSLNYLLLTDNRLSGGIPPSLGKLSVLKVLHLGGNILEGSIPPYLWNLSSLEYLSLSNNQLQGSLPQDLECGMTYKVSTHGDVYSYGILLMELFTRKRPTDGAFKEGLTLRTFVKDGLSEGLISTMDECLLANGVQANDHYQTTNHAKTFECVSLVLRIGIQCTNDLPMERMEIKKVRNELNDIKNKFFGRE